MKITRYLFLLIIIFLFFSGIFICHIYTAEATDIIHDYSDSCEGEILVNWDKTQSNKKLIIDFSLIISEKLSNLVLGTNINFTSSEDLNNSRIDELLTITKIE